VKRVTVAAVVVAAAVPLGLGVRGLVGGDRTTAPPPPEVTPTTVMSTTRQTEQTEPTEQTGQTVRFVPRPEDFTTVIRPLRRTCGLNIRPAPILADQRIAHCTITYRTAVRYRGKALDPSVTYTVSYQVLGTVNGSETYSFSIRGTHLTGLPVRTAVPSPGNTLSAVANDVERAP
jgi:hypothetical protein